MNRLLEYLTTGIALADPVILPVLRYFPQHSSSWILGAKRLLLNFYPIAKSDTSTVPTESRDLIGLGSVIRKEILCDAAYPFGKVTQIPSPPPYRGKRTPDFCPQLFSALVTICPEKSSGLRSLFRYVNLSANLNKIV